jgi:hypothetical protein
VDGYAEAAKTRVLEAIERGEKGVLPREDPIGDLVTYALARVLCLAVGEPWLLRRWALAEAARMERYLHTEEEGLRRMLLRRILSIEDADVRMVGRIGDDSYRYRLSVAEYLKISKGAGLSGVDAGEQDGGRRPRLPDDPRGHTAIQAEGLPTSFIG